MTRAKVLILAAAMLVGVTFLAAPASANYGDCNIIFVGGFVDRSCEAAIDSIDGTTCWFIGWWCG